MKIIIAPKIKPFRKLTISIENRNEFDVLCSLVYRFAGATEYSGSVNGENPLEDLKSLLIKAEDSWAEE